MKLSAVVLAVSGLCLNTAAAFRVPQFSWDSHIHIIDPERFPLSPNRSYTPLPATVHNCSKFQSSRGINHAVVVLPSVYGTNNSVLIDSLRFFNGSYRGIAVIDPSKPPSSSELDTWHDAGVRGFRVFTNNANVTEVISLVRKNAAIAAPRNWVIQLWLPLKHMVALHDVIPTLNCTVVVDHFGHTEAGSKTGHSADTIDPYQQLGFRELVDLVRRRLVFVKVSGPYQDSKDEPLYEDMRVIAETLMLAGPDMVVYASDWPHTSSSEGNGPGGPLVAMPYRDINDAALVEEFKDWAGSEAQVRRMFVDNPRRLWRWYDEDS